MATETETVEVDVKPNFSVFKHFGFGIQIDNYYSYETANFNAEAENNWCPITFAALLCSYRPTIYRLI